MIGTVPLTQNLLVVTAYMLTRTAINFWLKYDEDVVPLSDITIWAYPRYVAWIFCFDYFFVSNVLSILLFSQNLVAIHRC